MIKPYATPIGGSKIGVRDVLEALETISKQLDEIISKQPMYSIQAPIPVYSIQPSCECHRKAETSAGHICPLHG